MDISFKREPIIFPSREAVQGILDERIPNIAEDNSFKVCNFCGPYTTHGDGCRLAMKMFHESNPEYVPMEKFNNWLNKFRTGAGFRSTDRRSIVIFLSTVTEDEMERTYKRLYEAFVSAA